MHVWGKQRQIERAVPGLPVPSITVNRVCQRCNNGWLSELEDKARPLLTRPIRGDPTTLRGEDLRTVATWAYKTAILADLATGEAPNVGWRSYDDLYRYREPARQVGILIASYGGSRYPLYCALGQFPVTLHKGDAPEGKQRHIYLITLAIGHLVFQVFGCHEEGLILGRPAPRKEAVGEVIWPEPQPRVRWPPPGRIPLTNRTLIEFAESA